MCIRDRPRRTWRRLSGISPPTPPGLLPAKCWPPTAVSYTHLVSLEELHPALGGGGPETGLDIYCRGRTGLLADDGARWAVLILPGGGYERIAPAEGEPVALAFLAAGIQAFVLSYSVLPALWPRQFLEGAAALAWMRANAPELGFRPDQVAVCGFSAGGHLAGCLAGGYAEPLLNERLGLTPEQVRPDAAILGYPVVHEALYLEPLGGAEVLRPDRRVGPGHPPAFLWATVGDATVPVSYTHLGPNPFQSCGKSDSAQRAQRTQAGTYPRPAGEIPVRNSIRPYLARLLLHGADHRPAAGGAVRAPVGGLRRARCV